jgi:hypothetical protein
VPLDARFRFELHLGGGGAHRVVHLLELRRVVRGRGGGRRVARVRPPRDEQPRARDRQHRRGQARAALSSVPH